MNQFQPDRRSGLASATMTSQSSVPAFRSTNVVALETLVTEVRLMSGLPSRGHLCRYDPVSHRLAVDWPGSHLGPSNWRPDNRSVGDPAANLFPSLERSGIYLLGESHAREVANLSSVLPARELHFIRRGWFDEATHQLNDPCQMQRVSIHRCYQTGAERALAADHLANCVHRMRGASGRQITATDAPGPFNLRSSREAKNARLLGGPEGFYGKKVKTEDDEENGLFD